MKILFIGHDASRTGAPISLLTLINGIKNNAENWDLTLLLLNGGPFMNEYCSVVKTFVYKPKPKSRYLRIRNRFTAKENEIDDLRNFLSSSDADVIYINTIVPLPLILPQTINLKSKVICHVREMEMGFTRYLPENFIQSFSRIDKFFVVNSQIKNFLKTDYQISDELISVCPGPFDLNNYDKQIKKKEDFNFHVAMAGTPIFRKGIDIAIHLATLKIDQDIVFHWFGAIDPEREIEIRFEIEKRGLKEKFIIEKESTNLYKELHRMDMFFMCSREDPFPRVAIEASLAELPIIFFKNRTGLNDLFIDGISCLEVEYLNYESLVLKLHDIKCGRVKEVGENAREATISYLKSVKTLDKILNYLEKVNA